jgi:hypothetical protein
LGVPLQRVEWWLGGCTARNTRSSEARGFGLQNQKLNCAGLDLVWNMQIQAQTKG